MPLRIAMLDVARVTERHDRYAELIPRLAGWGYNALLWHFTDDEGCALRFARRPELTTDYAFTRNQTRDLIDLAHGHGLTVIPEIESLGHTGYLHGRPELAHLREPTAGKYNALTPEHPDARAVLRDLIHEAAEIFGSRYIHVGLDEANLGHDPERGREPWERYADHLAFLHETVTEALRANPPREPDPAEPIGGKMMMWADHLVSEPRLIERVPAGTIACHWQYRRDMPPAKLDALLDGGLDVVCCGATVRAGEVLMPSGTTQINLQRFSHVAHHAAARDREIVGLMNTFWETGRVVAGTEALGLALGGTWFADPAASGNDTAIEYAAEAFGLTGEAADEVGDAVLDLSDAVPNVVILQRLLGLGDPETPANPLTDFELREADALRQQADAAGRALAQHHDAVTRHHDEYAAYRLVADLCKWAADLGERRTHGYPDASRRELTDRGEGLARRVDAQWGAFRHADDPKRHGGHSRMGRHYVGRLVREALEAQQPLPATEAQDRTGER